MGENCHNQEVTIYTSIPGTTHLMQASVDEECPGLDGRSFNSARQYHNLQEES